MALTAATAFIRLNIVGLAYMLCLLVIVVGKRSLVARAWVFYVAIIAVLAIVQVRARNVSYVCMRQKGRFRVVNAGMAISSCHRPLSARCVCQYGNIFLP